MNGGDSKKTQTTTEATKTMLPEQRGAYLDLWGRAQTAMENSQNIKYTGDFLSPKTGQEQQGVDLLMANAGNAGTGASAVRDLAMKTLQGGFLPDLNNYVANPNLQGVIDSALNPIQKSLTNTVLPSIRSNAIASGAYGGSRQDLQENSAVADFTKQAADTTSQIAYKDFNDFMNRSYALYGQERAMQTAAPTLLSAATSLENAPAMQLLQAGQTQRSLDQIGLDNEMQKTQEARNSQWYGLGELANILQSGGFGSTTGYSNSVQTEKMDPFTQLLKGVIGLTSTAAGAYKAFG